MQPIIRRYLLPIAMILGICGRKYLEVFMPYIPLLISLMLFITFSKINLKDIKITKVQIILLLIQCIGSVAAYFALRSLDLNIAQSVMICILAPAATSAPVVTGILGGDVTEITTFSLLSNLSTALFAPIFLAFINTSSATTTFVSSSIHIASRVLPVLLAPLVLALASAKWFPKVNNKIKSSQIVALYLWGIALCIVSAKVVNLLDNYDKSSVSIIGIIAFSTLIICLVQFGIGRAIGKKYGSSISCAQGLGQKNTILAIWLAQMYLNPIAALGPGLYVVWQNVVNSYQIWKKEKMKN